jgi:hypothetical protein
VHEWGELFIVGRSRVVELFVNLEIARVHLLAFNLLSPCLFLVDV